MGCRVATIVSFGLGEPTRVIPRRPESCADCCCWGLCDYSNILWLTISEHDREWMRAWYVQGRGRRSIGMCSGHDEDQWLNIMFSHDRRSMLSRASIIHAAVHARCEKFFYNPSIDVDGFAMIVRLLHQRGVRCRSATSVLASCATTADRSLPQNATSLLRGRAVWKSEIAARRAVAEL